MLRHGVTLCLVVLLSVLPGLLCFSEPTKRYELPRFDYVWHYNFRTSAIRRATAAETVSCKREVFLYEVKVTEESTGRFSALAHVAG